MQCCRACVLFWELLCVEEQSNVDVCYVCLMISFAQKAMGMEKIVPCEFNARLVGNVVKQRCKVEFQLRRCQAVDQRWKRGFREAGKERKRVGQALFQNAFFLPITIGTSTYAKVWSRSPLRYCWVDAVSLCGKGSGLYSIARC